MKRSAFVVRLRALGFAGPVAGTNHAIMTIGRKRLAIPSDREYSVALQQRMLRQIGSILGRQISHDEWLGLR